MVGNWSTKTPKCISQNRFTKKNVNWQLNQLQQKRIIWGKNVVETKKKKKKEKKKELSGKGMKKVIQNLYDK